MAPHRKLKQNHRPALRSFVLMVRPLLCQMNYEARGEIKLGSEGEERGGEERGLRGGEGTALTDRLWVCKVSSKEIVTLLHFNPSFHDKGAGESITWTC